jgi:hypothetical protein
MDTVLYVLQRTVDARVARWVNLGAEASDSAHGRAAGALLRMDLAHRGVLANAYPEEARSIGFGLFRHTLSACLHPTVGETNLLL